LLLPDTELFAPDLEGVPIQSWRELSPILISDSAAAINAGADDLSNIDPDESLLYGQYGGRGGLGAPRRRNDDDDNETEVFDDDDTESLASMPVDGMKTLGLRGIDDEKELPAHACA
jgi:regulator of nonsense transcripts 1